MKKKIFLKKTKILSFIFKKKSIFYFPPPIMCKMMKEEENIKYTLFECKKQCQSIYI